MREITRPVHSKGSETGSYYYYSIIVTVVTPRGHAGAGCGWDAKIPTLGDLTVWLERQNHETAEQNTRREISNKHAGYHKKTKSLHCFFSLFFSFLSIRGQNVLLGQGERGRQPRLSMRCGIWPHPYTGVCVCLSLPFWGMGWWSPLPSAVGRPLAQGARWVVFLTPRLGEEHGLPSSQCGDSSQASVPAEPLAAATAS